MIYAQRPDATACADYEVWNEKMRRYVRRGSKGIALIDASGDKPRLRYVFDISDTGGGENSRRPFLWQYRPEHEDAVTAALEREYAISGEKGLSDQLERSREDGKGILGGSSVRYSSLVDDSFLRNMMSSNIEYSSETPPPSALLTPSCPVADWNQTNTLSMRTF